MRPNKAVEATEYRRLTADVGVILNIAGRLLRSQFSMVFGPDGERLGSFARRLSADVALPLQILGVIAVIHGSIVLFKSLNPHWNCHAPPCIG